MLVSFTLETGRHPRGSLPRAVVGRSRDAGLGPDATTPRPGRLGRWDQAGRGARHESRSQHRRSQPHGQDRRGRQGPVEQALDVVFGYTCGNDVTARDLQRKDGQWARAKGFDTFCPLGPWIETELDPTRAEVTCLVNGVVRQQGTTADLIFAVAQLIAYVTQVMTLEPGDIIMTGTPAGVGPLEVGDAVVVRIGGIGELHNTVVLP